MATYSPTVKVKGAEAKSGQGGGGPVIRFPGNGGGGGNGDSFPNFGEQLRRYRLGLAVGLAAVVMLFVSFTSAYIVRQGLGQWNAATNSYENDWVPLQLPVGLLLVNTLLLVGSSYSIEKARRAALQQVALEPVMAIPGIAPGQERNVPWLLITVVLGLGFLGGQVLAWQEMVRRGFFLANTPSGSFFYVLTGMHALHLAGGMIALLWALLATSGGTVAVPKAERRRIVVDVTAWYWHFMALLWVYVFALLQFAS
ncbi:MAG: heme-copper oxidase subunit III [Candidatus Korobacteraceae bacterium]